MDSGVPSSLFVNDGSFMEKFKQLQQGETGEGEKPLPEKDSLPKPIRLENNSKPPIGKTTSHSKTESSCETPQIAAAGKLAFSLKQKSKIVAPVVKLGEDEEEDAGSVPDDPALKKKKLDQSDSFAQQHAGLVIAPPAPSNPIVKKVADKLASFVAKNGKQFEDVTRQKNPGETPFRFLYDKTCTDYKYYEYKLVEEEKAFEFSKSSQTSLNGAPNDSTSKSVDSTEKANLQQPNYDTPASALYVAIEESKDSASSATVGSTGKDPIAMMDFYMKRAAEEESKRQPKQSKDEMPPPASLLKRGHHMGDYIPPEELERFLANCNNAGARKMAIEAAERAKIKADNIGHRLLSKMGWKEGEGLGSSGSGIADPLMAGEVKMNNLGVGAQQPGEVTPDDDIYEQYKKRMMLGYRYRPNPLNNPRKAYY